MILHSFSLLPSYNCCTGWCFRLHPSAVVNPKFVVGRIIHKRNTTCLCGWCASRRTGARRYPQEAVRGIGGYRCATDNDARQLACGRRRHRQARRIALLRGASAESDWCLENELARRTRARTARTLNGKVGAIFIRPRYSALCPEGLRCRVGI